MAIMHLLNGMILQVGAQNSNPSYNAIYRGGLPMSNHVTPWKEGSQKEHPFWYMVIRAPY